jgi:STE24 endopeptidase
MSPAFVLILFLVLLLVAELADLILLSLNISHVKRHSSSLPKELSEMLGQEQAEKNAQYTLATLRYSRVSQIFQLLLVLFVVISGFLGFFERALFSIPWVSALGAYSRSVIYILGLALLNSFVSIPFSLYKTFVLEEKFGFNTQSFGSWVKDFIKQLLVSFVLLVPLMYLLLFIMAELGNSWWVWASVLVIGFSLLMQIIYPTIIAPIFNKFSKLQGELKESIVALCERLEFPLAEVYEVDGSTRSKHSNAYFAGLGKSKRIVLYDTLIQSLKPQQLLAVLAHEIGHEKRAHIKKMIALSSIQTVFIFWLLSCFMNEEAFYLAFGFHHMSYHAALVLFSLFIGPLLYWLAPLFNGLLRKHEYEADAYAAAAMGSSVPLKEALLTLAQDNLSNLWPHPWYSFVHYSHPTLLERMDALEKVDS